MIPSGQFGPSVWSVSDGRAGNAAQVKAVLAALQEPDRWLRLAHIKSDAHRLTPLTLSPGLPWRWLPGADWPFPRQALPGEQRAALTPPWPTLWIAAGRRSASYTAAIREWSKGQTLTVQILDPRRDASDFDIVVVPQHDALCTDNTVRIIGSPTHFSESDYEEAGQRFADLADRRDKTVMVILGGHSRSHRFSQENARQLIAHLQCLTQKGWRLRITTSRRTPTDIASQIRQFAETVGAQFWSGPQDGDNPYLAWLIYSQAAIVTEDSANMLSDAAWHGLPLFIARLDGGAPKFDQLHESLIKAGAARWFDGTLDIWSYPPIREAERVAEHITECLLERYPPPHL